MPSLSQEYQWIRTSPIAHRGLHDKDEGRPENSLAAFDHACKNAFPIELDVHLAKDLEVVVIHDDDLLRLTGQQGRVGEFTSRELSQLHIEKSDQHLPSLLEVFELVRGRVPILVEIKNEGPIGGLEDQVLRLLDSYSGLVALQSFNPFSLRHIRLQAPKLIRGQLSGAFNARPKLQQEPEHKEAHEAREEQRLNYLKRTLLRHLALNGFSRPHFIGYEHDALPSPVVSLHRRLGIPVVAWTVRSKEEADQSLKFADNYIFERFLPWRPSLEASRTS
jgi:glycerophosphoryl diester phosphodiesterase